MKIIRGLVVFIASILFVISFFLASTFFVVSSSLNYDVIYPNLSYSVSEVLEDNFNLSSYLDNNYNYLVDYCTPHSFYLYNYSLLQFNLSCSDILLGENETVEAIYNINPLISNLSLTNIRAEISKNYASLNSYCANHNYYSSNISRVNISCDSILLGKEATKDSVLSIFVDDIYYRDYKCDYWDCLSKTGSTFFLISEKSSDYWKSKFYYFSLACICLLVLIFFCLETKIDIFLFLGVSSLICSFPLSKLESVLFFVIKPFFSGLDYLNFIDASTILSAFSVFFSTSGQVFKFLFTLGIVLIVFWVILKIFLVVSGRNKKTFSKKEVEKIVKKEIQKSKDKDEKSVEKSKDKGKEKSKSF